VLSPLELTDANMVPPGRSCFQLLARLWYRFSEIHLSCAGSYCYAGVVRFVIRETWRG